VTDLDVDRLTIRLAGHSASDARRLAALIGDGLADAATPPRLHDASAVHASLPGRAGEPVEATASRIVDAIVGALSRSA
jgi:hypothetical protein